MNKDKILEQLEEINYPGFSRDIVSFGIVSEASFSNGIVQVKIELNSQDQTIPQKIEEAIKSRLLQNENVNEVQVSFISTAAEGNQASTSQNNLAEVKRIIAIASGKGGVGKSTVAVNLSCALSQLQVDNKPLKIGLMDCDVYGPSVPQLLGSNQRPSIIGENRIAPNENFGVKFISMGLLVDEESPIIWRGPMVMKTIQQFAENVEWGELDFLLIDLPPGTGDAQLSLAQILPLDGAIIVTTPQKTAFEVARRGARMFQKVNVPILGVIENMSFFNDESGKKSYPFGKGGGEITAKSLETNVLSEIGLDQEIREGGDHGLPLVVADPDNPNAKNFASIAKELSRVMLNS